MPTNKSAATLLVFVTTDAGEKIVWNITGYHGEGWSKGSFTWDGKGRSKVKTFQF
jgi:YD repeat-containing protein